MSQFPHLPLGSPLPTSRRTWQAVVDAGRKTQLPAPGPRELDADFRTSQTLVFVKNNSGGDVDQFGVLGIDGPLIDPDDNEPEFLRRVLLSGVTPNIAAHRGKFVVLQQPLKSGAIGRGVVLGVTPATINVTTGYEQWADIVNSESGYLEAGPTGNARILWLNGTSGQVWGLVNIAPASGVVFPITMEETGGSAGDDTEDCSYTYTITDLNGNELDTDHDPTASPGKYVRPSLGPMVSATAGLACWVNDAGTLKVAVYWCNEALDPSACS